MKAIPSYKIFPLRLGTITRDNSNMMYMRDNGKKIDCPLIAWLVTDGKINILVDTGGTAPDGKRYLPYERSSGEDLESQLCLHGVKPSDVSIVIMTHLHWDHAGNNLLFPQARFFVQKNELQYAVCPLKIQEPAYDYDLIFKTKYIGIEGDNCLLPGISVINTPGHSPGSQSIIVNTKDGDYIIVGDLIGLYACYEADPMIVNGLHTNLFEYYDSLNRVKASNAKILPGHDPKVFEKKVYG
jgi:glyoxylase-like metal-dependent hydrolase (beta-lactamase superfamily II)